MLEGFHTTALCTTGTVSLGSRGRCFFKAGVTEAEEVEGSVELALDMVARFIVAGAVKETIVTGIATWAGEETVEGVKGVVLFCEGVRALPTRQVHAARKLNRGTRVLGLCNIS